MRGEFIHYSITKNTFLKNFTSDILLFARKVHTHANA